MMTVWLLFFSVGIAPGATDAGVFDGCQLGRPLDRPLEEMFVDCPKPIASDYDGGPLPDDATAAVTASSSVVSGTPQAALDAAYDAYRRGVASAKDRTTATAPLTLSPSKGLTARRFSAAQRSSPEPNEQWELVVARPLSGGKVRVSRCSGWSWPAGAWAEKRCRELLGAINTNGVPLCLRPPGPYVLDARVTLEVPAGCCVTSVFGTRGTLECPDSTVEWWQQKDVPSATTELRARAMGSLGDAGTQEPCTFLGGQGDCINVASRWTGRGVAHWSMIRRDDVVFVCTSMKTESEGASALCRPPRPR